MSETLDSPAPSRAGGLDMSRMPYQLPFPKEASAEVVVPSVLPEDAFLNSSPSRHKEWPAWI